jgi:hypothetical protein
VDREGEKNALKHRFNWKFKHGNRFVVLPSQLLCVCMLASPGHTETVPETLFDGKKEPVWFVRSKSTVKRAKIERAAGFFSYIWLCSLIYVWQKLFYRTFFMLFYVIVKPSSIIGLMCVCGGAKPPFSTTRSSTNELFFYFRTEINHGNFCLSSH